MFTRTWFDKEKSVYNFAVLQSLFNDFFSIFGFNLNVKNVFWHYCNKRTLLTETMTTALRKIEIFLLAAAFMMVSINSYADTSSFDFFFKSIDNFKRTVSNTSSTCANYNTAIFKISIKFFSDFLKIYITHLAAPFSLAMISSIYLSAFSGVI